MSIQTVERVPGNEDMLRVTMDGGAVHHVPDDPGNSSGQLVAEWEAGGGTRTIAAPSAAQRRGELKARKRDQVMDYARRRALQHENEHQWQARMNRASLYASRRLLAVHLCRAVSPTNQYFALMFPEGLVAALILCASLVGTFSSIDRYQASEQRGLGSELDLPPSLAWAKAAATMMKNGRYPLMKIPEMITRAVNKD